MQKTLLLAKQSHLEMRTLAAAMQFGNLNGVTSGCTDIIVIYHQLAKWYEEGHHLVNDYAKLHRTLTLAKDAMHPKLFTVP